MSNTQKPPIDMPLDEVLNLNMEFKSLEEAEQYLNTEQFERMIIEKYKYNPPAMIELSINGIVHYGLFAPEKQGIPMDFRFYSGLDEITAEDISKEPNAEKRRLLISEYGWNNYLKDVKIIDENPHYGTLLSAIIDDGVSREPQQFVRVRNGTIEPEHNRKYLRERGMLTEDNHKIYFIPVSDEVKTAKEGIEESWGIPRGTFKDTGWDAES